MTQIIIYFPSERPPSQSRASLIADNERQSPFSLAGLTHTS